MVYFQDDARDLLFSCTLWCLVLPCPRLVALKIHVQVSQGSFTQGVSQREMREFSCPVPLSFLEHLSFFETLCCTVDARNSKYFRVTMNGRPLLQQPQLTVIQWTSCWTPSCPSHWGPTSSGPTWPPPGSGTSSSPCMRWMTTVDTTFQGSGHLRWEKFEKWHLTSNPTWYGVEHDND